MKYVVTLLVSLPIAAFAAPPQDFKGVVSFILGYITLLIPLIFALAFIVIIWGVIKAWIINGGDAEKVSEGRTIALWGIVGLVVMAGMWGIIAIVRSSLFNF